MGSMLCYPTMILLYPFYILALCVLERQHIRPGEGRKARSPFSSSCHVHACVSKAASPCRGHAIPAPCTSGQTLSSQGRWLLAALVLAAALMQAKAVYGFLFEDKNQFYFQVRYVAVLLPGIVLGIRGHRRMARWLYLLVLPGLVSVPLVLFVTNMDTNVTYAKAFVGVPPTAIVSPAPSRRYLP